MQVDNATLALASAVAVALVVNHKLRPPPPQVNPFLLGRQSVASPTRHQGESPVYTNHSNGGVRAPYRPDRNIRTLRDILDQSGTVLEGGQRGLWIQGGEKVVEVVNALRAGLVQRLGGEAGRVLVALEDPTDALLVILAFATSPYKPVVVPAGTGVPSGLDVLAVVGTSAALAAGSSSLRRQVLLDDADEAKELLADGRRLISEGKDGAAEKGDANDVVLTMVSDGVSLDFTNQNLTASLVSWLSLFPVSPKPTKPTLKDYAVSLHHPSTSFGLGLALLAIFQSASLSLPTLPAEPTAEDILALLTLKSAPPATLIFAPAKTFVDPLYKLVLQQLDGDASFIVRHARDGKLRLLREGTVSKQTFWDSILWKGLRKDINLTSLRAIYLSSPPAIEQSRLDTLRCALGCPTVVSCEHPLLLAPLSVGHMFDVQRLPPPGVQRLVGDEKSHVGAPTLGMEIKLKGDESDMADGRIKGEILVRTPVLPAPTSLPSSLLLTDESLPQLPPYPGQAASTTSAGQKWLRTGVVAEMSTEGTLWLQ
ncbi:hypothetical protein JCM10296v2_001759 [Rhodotorula toruloides]